MNAALVLIYLYVYTHIYVTIIIKDKGTTAVRGSKRRIWKKFWEEKNKRCNCILIKKYFKSKIIETIKNCKNKNSLFNMSLNMFNIKCKKILIVPVT